MAGANDTASMALFCDFENIALGVRDAQYEKFDIKPVLERLLAKGSIVVKKAYCDWERYKGFKAAMHEANFELIEIPHVRQSGKNSADIRMVVDALDLCYTKAHVDTFVIISGDSDFSPLVSKLRENAKKVIGVGVKQSCSDLLVTNCDEFIYYDDLVRERESQRSGLRRERDSGKRTPEEEQKRREKQEERKTRAVELAAATFADMIADRGDNERIWASVLKEVIKRRNPGFNESYFGFRTFGNLLEEAAQRGLLSVGRDEKSGNYVMRAQARPAESLELADGVEPEGGSLLVGADRSPSAVVSEEPAGLNQPVAVDAQPVVSEGGARRRQRGRGRKSEASAVSVPAGSESSGAVPGDASTQEAIGQPVALLQVVELASVPAATPQPQVDAEGGATVVAAPKRSRKPARKERVGQKNKTPRAQSTPDGEGRGHPVLESPAAAAGGEAPAAAVNTPPEVSQGTDEGGETVAKPVRKRAPRTRKPKEAVNPGAAGSE